MICTIFVQNRMDGTMSCRFVYADIVLSPDAGSA